MAESPPDRLPVGLQFYARAVAAQIFGGEPPIFTEKDFRPAELVALRKARDNAVAAGRSFIAFEDYETIQPPPGKFDPDVLGSRASNIFEEMDMMFTDPARSAMFAIGRANFEGDRLTDQYNFHAPPEAKLTLSQFFKLMVDSTLDENPRSMFNLIGNVVGLRNNAGPRVEINLGEILAEAPDQSSLGL